MTRRTAVILRAAKNLSLSFFIAALLFIVADSLPALAAESKSDWKADWDKTLQAAKKESQLTVYHWGAPLILDAGVFQKSYPEIKITTVEGMGTQLMQRILAERRGEKYIPDVYIAGIATMQVLHRAKVFDPIKSALALPEVVDSSKWWRGAQIYADTERGHVFAFAKSPDYGSIAFNPNLVNPKEFRSYWDLLRSKWKGKIAVQDLRGGGPGSTQARFFYYNPDLGAKYLRRLYSEMDATLFRDNHLALDWLASGKVALTFFVQGPEELQEKGLPVEPLKIAMKEGVGLSSRVGYIALLNRAPHPNAARVFINWFLSREGQEAYQRVQFHARNAVDSLRIDVAKDYIPVADRRAEGVRYLDVDEQDYLDPAPALQVIKETLAERKN
jgi:iron(III) transport system substrate-binding protein